MTAALPRLRRDLIVRQATPHAPAILKDPATSAFFRLGEAELFITQQLDGETSLDVIRQRAEARFGGVLPVETLAAFLQTLKHRGLLDAADGHARRAQRKSSRFRGGVLYCRFKLFDPHRLLRRLHPWAGLCYTRTFGVLSALAILTAVAVTITHWTDVWHELPRLYASWPALVAVVALNFLVVGAHEFGHGLTCTRFGGEVRDMGCALIFLQPAFYCNVTDAWFFSKAQRLWVGFAGPYVELLLWALAVWTWRVTEPDTWIHFAGLSVMTTSGLKTLLNFNPLIKFDGYYLLSDYLDIPNLRRRSFRYVGRMTERVFGLESSDEAEPLTPREKTIFFTYGTVALAGSFAFLAYIVLTAGGALIDRRSPAAVFAMMGFLGIRYRRRLRRVFGGRSGVGQDLDDDDDASPVPASAEPAPIAADEAQPAAAPVERRTGRKSRGAVVRRWVRRVLWLMVAIAVALAIMYGRAELRIRGPFSVHPIENTDVRAPVDGIIETIFVREGDRVQKGDVIAELYDKDLVAQLRTTEAQIAQADATLKKLKAGPMQQEIDVATATVNKSKEALSYAQSRLVMMKRALTRSCYRGGTMRRWRRSKPPPGTSWR